MLSVMWALLIKYEAYLWSSKLCALEKEGNLPILFVYFYFILLLLSLLEEAQSSLQEKVAKILEKTTRVYTDIKKTNS